MVYATWSEGFRPGGINRSGTHSALQVGLPDQLRARLQDHLGQQPPALQRRAVPGRLGRLPVLLPRRRTASPRSATPARRASRASRPTSSGPSTDGFTLSTSLSLLDAKTTVPTAARSMAATTSTVRSVRAARRSALRQDGHQLLAIPLAPPGTFLQAPKGQELPVQPKFKGNAVGRYEFPMGRAEGAPPGRPGSTRAAPGRTCAPPSASCWASSPSYSIVDLAAGIDNDSWGLELFVKNVFDERAEIARFAECSTFKPATDPANRSTRCRCAACEPYMVTNTPRTIGLTFSKHF